MSLRAAILSVSLASDSYFSPLEEGLSVTQIQWIGRVPGEDFPAQIGLNVPAGWALRLMRDAAVVVAHDPTFLGAREILLTGGLNLFPSAFFQRSRITRPTHVSWHANPWIC